MNITFTVPGVPRGKQRPYFSRLNKKPHTPEQTKSYEEMVAWAYRQKYNGSFGDQPLGIMITAVMPIPKRVTVGNRKNMIAGRIRPTVKPDWDNIGKIVCDALNGVAYNDDKQIVSAFVFKIYGENPNVTVTLFDNVEDLAVQV